MISSAPYRFRFAAIPRPLPVHRHSHARGGSVSGGQVTTIGDIAVALQAYGQDAGGSIAIEPIEVDTEASAGLAPIVAMRLLPEGATFDQPVTLRIQLAGPPEDTVVGYHLSEGETGIEVLDFTPVDYDEAAGLTSYETSLTHFSEVHVATWGNRLEARFMPELPGETYFVGDSFLVRARATPEEVPGWDYWVDNRRQQVHVAAVNGAPPNVRTIWSSAGSVRGYDFADVVSFDFVLNKNDYDSSPLEPATVAPTEREVQPGTVVDAEQRFTCVRTGRFFVFFRGYSVQPAVATFLEGSTVVKRKNDAISANNTLGLTGVCVLPEGSATPTSQADPRTPTPMVAPSETAIATGEVIPTVVVPPEPGVPTPVTGTGELEGFIKVYAYDGVWYDGSALVVTEAHLPHCSYVHLHGGPIQSILPGPGGQPTTIQELYGECGYGPTNALYWIEDPR